MLPIYCRWDLPWDDPVLYDLVVISWLQRLSNPSSPFSMGKFRTFPMDPSRIFQRLRSPRFKSQGWGFLPFHVSMYTTILYSITNIYSVTLGFVWILQAKLFEFDVENQPIKWDHWIPSAWVFPMRWFHHWGSGSLLWETQKLDLLQLSGGRCSGRPYEVSADARSSAAVSWVFLRFFFFLWFDHSHIGSMVLAY